MKVPKSWSGVTIQQYYNFLDTLDLPLSEEDKAIAMLSALTDTDIEFIKEKISVAELGKALNSVKFISDSTPSGNVRPVMKIGRKRIAFDLILRDSIANSFINLSELCKNSEKAKKNVHNIIAVFCYELNWLGFRKKRTINSQRKLAEFLLNNMTMEDGFRYRDFFLLSYKTLLKSTLDYLGKKRERVLRELKRVV